MRYTNNDSWPMIYSGHIKSKQSINQYNYPLIIDDYSFINNVSNTNNKYNNLILRSNNEKPLIKSYQNNIFIDNNSNDMLFNAHINQNSNNKPITNKKRERSKQLLNQNQVEPKISNISGNKSNIGKKLRLKYNQSIKEITENEWSQVYELDDILGQGAFGITYLAYDKVYNNNVAVKIIDISEALKKGMDIDGVIKEIDILSGLSKKSSVDLDNNGCHPYIVCYYDGFLSTYKNKYSLFIVSEYIDGINLYEWMKENNSNKCPPNIDLLWNMMNQMIIALEYIHNKGYAHKDIKPENIMIENNNNKIKIIDFGLSCYKYQCNSKGGTLIYMPPEIISKDYPNSLQGSQAHDIWSMGVVFYQLANLKFPYDVNSYLNGLYNIYLSDYDSCEISNSKIDNITTSINSIIDKMLETDWIFRPKASDILQSLNQIDI